MSKKFFFDAGFGWREPPEVVERRDRVRARATAVFGNDHDASLWLSMPGNFGPPGEIKSPSDIAAASEDGCLAVIARLDELDPVTPKKPLPENIRRARAGVRPGRRRKSDFTGGTA